MLHTKFRGNRPAGSTEEDFRRIFTIYGRVGHLGHALRKHPHMFYTPSFTLLYSRKGEMRGTQNEDLFSGLD